MSYKQRSARADANFKEQISSAYLLSRGGKTTEFPLHNNYLEN